MGTPRRRPPKSPFHLVLDPRETLVVLEFLVSRQGISPGKAAEELRIGINTWYRAVLRLEALGLVSITRAPGGKKIRTIVATAEGRELAANLGRFEALVRDSRAVLEWELANRRPEDGSERAGEILCSLVENAERRGDLTELSRLEKQGAALGRTAESALAGAIAAFLGGKHAQAEAKAQQALHALPPQANTRTSRKALFVLLGSKEYLGKPREAIMTGLALRAASRRANDFAMEAEAGLAIGILKARRDNVRDAAREMRRALACAERGVQQHQRAKILSNLCLVEFLTNPDRGEAVADEALKSAREAGSRIALGRIQMNRALMFAWRLRRKEAEKSMRDARHHFKEGGEEKGKKALRAWGVLVRRTYARPRPFPIEALRRDVSDFVSGGGSPPEPEKAP